MAIVKIGTPDVHHMLHQTRLEVIIAPPDGVMIGDGTPDGVAVIDGVVVRPSDEPPSGTCVDGPPCDRVGKTLQKEGERVVRVSAR